METIATEFSALREDVKKNNETLSAAIVELTNQVSALQNQQGIQLDNTQVGVAYEVTFLDGRTSLYASKGKAPAGSKPVAVLARYQYGFPIRKLNPGETLTYQMELEAKKLEEALVKHENCKHSKSSAYAVMGFDGQLVFFKERSIAVQAAGKAGQPLVDKSVHYYDGIPCQMYTMEEEEVDGE